MWNITKMLSVANPLHISPRVNKLGFSDRMQGIEEVTLKTVLCTLKTALYTSKRPYVDSKEHYIYAFQKA